MKAVIPAAGFGTRFLPLTKAQPKEMLPVVNKPTLQWVIEEAVDAGIKDIAIITGEHKQSIENHFRPMKKLEQALEASGKVKELEKIRKVNEIANLEFIIQEEQKGLGHAILCAEDFVADNPFAGVCLGILATILVQSSSTSTSLIVTAVASGELSVKIAVAMVMGANIGTTITNTLVAFLHSREQKDFGRAIAGATVHDLFNFLMYL